MSVIGRPVAHESAVAHVTGAAKYTDDLAGSYAGCLSAWPVTAPHAHARVLAISCEAALASPGVVTVLTAADVPGENDTGAVVRDEPLFPSVVAYHGQPVVWVLGQTEDAARLGASLVVVEYEPLPAILEIEEAIAAESYHTEPQRIERGEPWRVIAESELVVRGELRIGGQEHFYLEAQAAIAYFDEDDALFVHSSTQHPSETQEICARVLGLESHRVTCQSLRMGGAFGGKEVQANPFAAVAAVGARKTGKPVRVRLDRRRDIMITGKRHPFFARYEAAHDATGKLLAVSIELWSDGGYSLDLSAPVMGRALFHVDNAYLVPHLKVTGRVCKTHKTSQTAFRGFGGPQGMIVIEEILDRVARAIQLAPHLVRERNFYREGDEAHYGQRIKDADRIATIWNELRRRSDFDARLSELQAWNAAHEHSKRGLAITPVKFGISFTTSFFNQGGALVLVYRDGSVQCNHGGTEMGQGLHTKIQQIAAQSLGVPLHAVRIMPTRTDKVPNTSATAASSGTDLNGAAVRAACETLRRRMAEVAGRMLSSAPDDLVFEDGHVFHFHDRATRLSFAEVAKRAYLDRVQLFASGYYRTPHIHFDHITGRGKPFHYYAYGAAVSEVEVDGFTGQYDIRRIDIVQDVGDSLSPTIDRGQIEGGFMQGLGWLTREELLWDASGRVTTAGASTYKLPTLGECPEAFHVHLLERAPEPSVIYGSKAVGEPPFMLAFSVREALREAVAAFASAPARVDLAVPATPEAVFWALRAVQRDAARAVRTAAE